MNDQATYIALLRGVNVGGRHKVPMAELRSLLERQGFSNIKTYLNSGNIRFRGALEPIPDLEDRLTTLLSDHFGFSIPVLILTDRDLYSLVKKDPFAGITVTNSTRLYVSVTKEKPTLPFSLPWASEDSSYHIIGMEGRILCSRLNLEKRSSTEAMAVLEKYFGKQITTRNWNTLKKIEADLK